MVNDFPQALTIAGSDSDGSAGVQADLHSFFQRHVYGASVLTACVAGNSYGIHDSVNLPISFINNEFKSLADDYKIGASKTGMLSDSELVDAVVENYKKYDFGPLVVDPVITTKHGNMLLEQSAYQTLRDHLIPLAAVITPNFFEAQKLAEMDIKSENDMVTAAQRLKKLGAKNIIIKGSHSDPKQKKVSDYVLLESGDDFWLTGDFYDTERKNGTGDSLSAVITAELAKNNSVEDAIRVAKKFVDQAIASQIPVGHKFGPINHWAPEI
ncbi:bifunctional hydroxymethylpyrimidine kinase/phosphomethylpyrimidine kinase [Oenococcus alcoholitolerans]|uniref:bifunctional hydroxymethylpyrimidine kinase/phosphomethylpyrimidine kinase n=1 Tax=Oenococcus alcoholitolerans TaxID=931074 RepID=UPI003F6F84AF